MGNPNHDPKTGEFTEGSSAMSSGFTVDLKTGLTPAQRDAAAREMHGGKLGSAAHASGKSTGDKTSDKAVKNSGLSHGVTQTERKFEYIGRKATAARHEKERLKQLAWEKKHMK